MSFFYQNLWQIVLMLVFVGISALLAASETALLSLSRRQLTLFSQSKNRLANIVAILHRNPKGLLAGLLLAVMIANTLFFALLSIFALSAQKHLGSTSAAVLVSVFFVIFVLFGEMLPKSIAYANPELISKLASLPVFFIVKALAPVRIFLTSVFVEPALRLIIGVKPLGHSISVNQFRMLVEASRRRGLISADENQLLGEVLEFGSLKVRQVMRPRVDIIAAESKMTGPQVRDIMTRHRVSKLPLYAGSIDNVLGIIHLRQLLLKPDQPLIQILEPARFVPEQKTVESLLEFFKTSRTDLAIVVDEYGQVAGTVSLQDIIEELVGPLEIMQGIAPVQQVGPLTYRLAGNLAIHDWASAFGIDPEDSRLATVGGLVTALLGKIPSPGDTAILKNLKFTVELVRRNRIESVILSLEPIETRDKSA